NPGLPANEDGAGVARPDAIGGPNMETDVLETNVREPQDFAGKRFFVRALDDNVHLLHAAEMPNDVGINPGYGRELSGPVAAIVRPRDPGCRVRLPFGRHSVAQSGWRGLAPQLRHQSRNL